MDDFIEVEASYQKVHIAVRPVSLPEFQAFLATEGRPLPAGVKRAPVEGQPVIGATHGDAAAYCAWVGRRVGHRCRLPSTDELDALMPHTTVAQAHGVVPDAGFWPHEAGRLAELRGGLKPLFLCEWTRDIEEAASEAHPERVMARIFYPPWLREGNNPLHMHASLLASESYSFVTFRVSYEG